MRVLRGGAKTVEGPLSKPRLPSFARVFLCGIFCATLVSGCKDTGGKVEGSVQGGILDRISAEVSSMWNFAVGADYVFDPAHVQVSGNKASLRTLETTFDDSVTFNRGNHVGTVFSGGALSLDAAAAADTSLSPTWTPKWSHLVGYWKMDGDWLDSSGNDLHGTGQGGVLANGTGRVGAGAGSFDGSDDYVTFGNTSAFDFGSATSFSVSTWVKWSSCTTGNRRILSNGSLNNTSGFLLYCNGAAGAPGKIGGTIGSDGTASKTVAFLSTSNYNDNSWHHVVLSVDQNARTLRLYVDGAIANIAKYDGTVCGSVMDSVYDYSNAGCQTNASHSGVSTLGSDRGAQHFWSGSMDDTSIWSAALSASDVALIYNRQKQKYAGSYDSPVLDAGAAGFPWNSLTVRTSLPFSKELPATSESSGALQYSGLSAGLMSGLAGLWHLNETATTAGVDNDFSDSSGFGRHGELVGTTAALGKSGRFGKGLQVWRSNGAVLLPAFDLGDQFTLSIWAKLNSVASQALTLFANKGSTATADGFFFHVSDWSTGNGALRFNVGNGTTGSTPKSSTNSAVSFGEWNHIVAVVNRSALTVDLYVNGLRVGAGASLVAGFNTSNAIQIGKAFGNSNADGLLDEAAIWTRALSAGEVLELYRRGANRATYQARSCVDALCACKAYNTSPAGSAADCDGDGVANGVDASDAYAAEWIGPDGTAATYFSEVQNNLAVDTSGNPTGSVQTTGLTLDWSGSFFAAAARPAANRYFQYRIFMESDDGNNLCSSAPCMPEVKSVTVGPTGRYYGGSPAIVNNTAVAFSRLHGMTKSDSNSCSTYQLSIDDGSTWKWWNGSAWADASDGVSTSNDVSDFTASRLQSLGAGKYRFKAFLKTDTSGDFSQSCELDGVGITYKP